MTWHKNENSFTCDTCPEDIDCDGREFAEAKQFAFSKGWRTYKGPDGQWANSCPSCVVDFAKAQQR